MDRRQILRGGLATAALLGSSCNGTVARAAEVSVADLGAAGNGRADDTAVFQAALDRLRSGGILRVPAGTYLLGGLRVLHRNVRVELSPGAVLRRRNDPELRGIFNLVGLREAGFELSGGRIDLNCEGPMRIGQPGLIRNGYSHHVVPHLIGIAGPLHAAVFALRSNGISVTACSIANSSENGLLFRNCGQVSVRGCQFSNIANYGVEFSFLAAAGDGGQGSMPPRDDCEVVGCSFEDIDDYALGSGNGCGVGGGGMVDLGGMRNYRITDCTFARCQRDIHFELWQGSWMEDVEIARIASRDARQGCIGLVSVRNSVIRDIVIDNPGSAPTALMVAERPEIYGVLLSTGASNVILRNVTIRDNRVARQYSGSGASIDRGSNRVSVSRDTFRPEDAGSWIGISGANPESVTYVGRIARVISARDAELDLPAGATVRGSRFAVGGMIRNGIVLTASEDISLDNVLIDAATTNDAASAAEAAPIRMRLMNGEVSFNRTTLRTAGVRDAALRVSGNRVRLVGVDGIDVQGFAQRVARTP